MESSTMNTTSTSFSSLLLQNNENGGLMMTPIAMGGTALLGLFLYLVLGRDKKSEERKEKPHNRCIPSIPHVRSKIPYIGGGIDFFQSPVEFVDTARKEYGDTFTATVFGSTHLFLFEPADVSALLALPEKKASMTKAYHDLAGSVLPKNPRSYASQGMKEKINTHGSGPIAHSVRPNLITSWIPMIQDVLDDAFADMKKSGSGQMDDLWEWCQDVICAVTVRVLLGNRATSNSTLLRDWVNVFHEANPEAGFGSPLKGLSTLFEMTLLGERQVYVRARKLILPLIDDEIERCIAMDGKDDEQDSTEDGSVLREIVKSWYKTKLNKSPAFLRAARIRLANEMFLFTFAAFSNSFASAAWTLYHAIRNTNGLGDDIRNEFQDGQYTEDCPHLVNTIMEVGRLYTPGAARRKTLTPFQLPSLDDVVVPAHTTVLISAYHCMRHADHFTNPCQFDSKLRYDGPNDQLKKAGRMLFPFGTGSHPCVGKRFAVMEISLLVAQTLATFDLEIMDTFKECAFTKQAITNCPNHPPLDKAQPGFIWRPAGPVKVRYQVKPKQTQRA